MPSAVEILEGLHVAAERWRWVAIAWHGVIAVVAFYIIWVRRRRTFTSAGGGLAYDGGGSR